MAERRLVTPLPRMTNPNSPFDAEARLTAIYEEIMWLARRSDITPSEARACYTHVTSGRLRRYLRMFSGRISQQALQPDAVLRLEHFKRLQTTLTKLVAKHLREVISDPSEFIHIVTDCEQVHIVTARENYETMKAGGDYPKAGIVLLEWHTIPPEAQSHLWKKILRGRVSNAQAYKPKQPTRPNQSLEPTAGRSDASQEIMKTHPVQSTLAAASGGSARSR